jgi:hypothetical protein
MAADDQIDRLYGLPLSEFTAARNALAKELGGEQGKRVKALRKPSVAAWAHNQAVRGAPDKLREFLSAGEELREAYEALMGGGERKPLEDATRRERAAAGALADEAQRAAGSDVHDKVIATLRAALADDEARAELEVGRVVREREAVALGPLGTVAPPAREKGKREPTKAERARAARAELKEARARAKETERRARDAGQKVAAARERAEAAMEALERAQREEQEAGTAAEAAAVEVERLERSLS